MLKEIIDVDECTAVKLSSTLEINCHVCLLPSTDTTIHPRRSLFLKRTGVRLKALRIQTCSGRLP